MKNTILDQEETFSFQRFSHEDAFAIGRIIRNIVLKRCLKPVRIRIVYKGDIVFQYIMDGKTGDMWLNLKQRTVEEYKHSGYYLYLVNEETNCYKDLTVENGYALCGGSFPLYVKGKYEGCFIVSGLAHEEDHQLIVDALKEYHLVNYLEARKYGRIL